MVSRSNRDNRNIQDVARGVRIIAAARLVDLVVVGFLKNGTECHGADMPFLRVLCGSKQ